jgi:hypothetical protein
LKEHKGQDKQNITAPRIAKSWSWSSEARGNPTEQEETKHRNGYPPVEPEIEQIGWESKHKADPQYEFIRSAQIESQRGNSSPNGIHQNHDSADQR